MNENFPKLLAMTKGQTYNTDIRNIVILSVKNLNSIFTHYFYYINLMCN